jgi:hypothetical protein
MLRLSVLIALLLNASVGHAEVDPLLDLAKGQPKDVVAVAERIAMCTHFAGEEPYDAERRSEISGAMKKYRCEKLDKDEAIVRNRHKDNAAVQRVLQRAHEW